MYDLEIEFLKTSGQWCLIYTAPAGVSHDFFKTKHEAIDFIIGFYVPMFQKKALEQAAIGMIEQANFYLVLANEQIAKYQGVLK